MLKNYMMNHTVIILLLILMIIIALNYKKISYHKMYKVFLKNMKNIIDEQIKDKKYKKDKIDKKYIKDKKDKKSIKNKKYKNKKEYIIPDDLSIENISIDNITEEELNFKKDKYINKDKDVNKDKDDSSFLSDVSSIDLNTIDNSNNTNVTPLSFD